jgi:peptide deformylase
MTTAPLDLNAPFVLNIKDEKPKVVTDRKIKYVNGQTYEYEIYKLIDQYDPFLKQKSAEAVDFSSESQKVFARYLAVSLIETMKQHRGIGLAANQVGLPYRVFVMGSEGVGFAFFNPEILEVTGEDKFKEGCLTFPGLFLPVTRPATVKIRYQDMNGETKEESFTGLSARIVLHEYDHLEGHVFTDRVSRVILERERGKVKKNLKTLKAQQLVEEKQAFIRKAMEKMIQEQKKNLQPDQSLTKTANNTLIFKA